MRGREVYVILRCSISTCHTAGALNGFTDIGDINSHIATYENQLSVEEIAKPLATSMLVMMVIGLFSKLKYPYAQFPCTELSGKLHKLYV